VEAGEVDPADVDRFVGQQVRLQAMSCLVSWTDGWSHDYKTLESLLLGIADMDGDEEVDQNEEAYFNDLLAGVSEAMLSLGADRGLIDSFLNDENKVSGDKIAEYLADKLNLMEARPDELVTNYGLGAQAILESTQTIIRGGDVVIKKKRVRKRRLTSLQKIASKKNLRRAHSGLAKARRERSMRVGRQRGLYSR